MIEGNIIFKCKFFKADSHYDCNNPDMQCGKEIVNSFCSRGYIKFDWIDYIRWKDKYVQN